MNVSSLEAYATALREDVCTICASYTPDGCHRLGCLYESSGACVVFHHLPELVELVERFRDSEILSFDSTFPMYVCTRCPHADIEGVCDMRDRSRSVPHWCVIDAYLPQIVGAIERVDEVKVASTD